MELHRITSNYIELYRITSKSFRKHLSHNAGISEDPVKIVVKSWPWKGECQDLPQALRPLVTRRPLARPQDEELLQKDPLVSDCTIAALGLVIK